MDYGGSGTLTAQRSSDSPVADLNCSSLDENAERGYCVENSAKSASVRPGKNVFKAVGMSPPDNVSLEVALCCPSDGFRR